MFSVVLRVVERRMQIYGTGSYPWPPQGWHRRIRRTVRYNPLNGPCFLNASIAYCEHVGVNLHEGGLSGDMHT